MNRAKHWYYRKPGEESDGEGPFDSNEIRSHYESGQLVETDEIRDNSFEWKDLRDHSLFALIRAPQPKAKPRAEKPIEPVPEAPPERSAEPKDAASRKPRFITKAPEWRRGGKDSRDKITGRNWYNLRFQYRFFTIIFQVLLLHVLLIFSDVLLVSEFSPAALGVLTFLLFAAFFVLAVFVARTLRV